MHPGSLTSVCLQHEEDLDQWFSHKADRLISLPQADLLYLYTNTIQYIFCAPALLLSIRLLSVFKQQVGQRATVAHLSPMCQGQISFKKTYKWAMETRGLKSNLSELLCLSWLPATLMMIRSPMNELAWRHHFPIISLRESF